MDDDTLSDTSTVIDDSVLADIPAGLSPPRSPTSLELENWASSIPASSITTERLSNGAGAVSGSTHAHPPSLAYTWPYPNGAGNASSYTSPSSRVVTSNGITSPGFSGLRPRRFARPVSGHQALAEFPTALSHSDVAEALSFTLMERRWYLPTVNTLARLLLSDIESQGMRAATLEEEAVEYLERLRNGDIALAPSDLEDGRASPLSELSRQRPHMRPTLHPIPRRNAVSFEGWTPLEILRPRLLRLSEYPNASTRPQPARPRRIRRLRRTLARSTENNNSLERSPPRSPPRTPPPRLTGAETRFIPGLNEQLPVWRALLGEVQPPSNISLTDGRYELYGQW